MPKLEAKETYFRTQEENIYPYIKHWLHGMHLDKSSLLPREFSIYTLQQFILYEWVSKCCPLRQKMSPSKQKYTGSTEIKIDNETIS